MIFLENKQRVNIDVNRELWKQVGIKSAETGMEKREILEEALKKYIEKIN